MPPAFSQLPATLSRFTHKPAVRRTAVGILAFVVLLGLFGYFVLPGIVKSQAEKILTQKLHRSTTIGKVDINPYTLRITLHDFRVQEPGSDGVFASFDALTVGMSYQSLWRLAPVVHELQLIGPYLHLVRKDATHYNIDDLLALAHDPSQPPSAAPARFSLFNIRIDQGRIDFEDKPTGAHHAVTDLRLGIPFISSLPSQAEVYVQPLLSAKVNGAPLLLKGKARPFSNPRDAAMDLDLDRIDLTSYLQYIPGNVHFKVPSALLDVHLTASFRQSRDQAPALTLNGELRLHAVRVNTESGQPIARLASAVIQLHEAKPFGGQVDIARLTLDRLEAHVARDAKGQLNLANLLTPATPAVPTPRKKDVAATPAPAGPAISLAQLDIRDATLHYTDAQQAQPLQADISKIDLHARGLTLDGAKKAISLDALRSDGAHLALVHGKPRKAVASDAARSPPAASRASGDAPYLVTVRRLGISNWTARLEDRSVSLPAVTTIAPLSLTMNNLSSAPGARSQLDLKAAVNQNGQLAVKGSLGIAPLYADLALDLRNVDIMQAQPYVTEDINILVTRANLSGKGALRLERAKNGELNGGYRGSLTLGNVATVDKMSANDFLRWRALSFDGMALKLKPFSLTVDRVSLDDFFARVIIDPTGRLNLQDVQRSEVGHKSVTDEAQVEEKSTARGNSKTVVLPAPGKPARAMPPIKIGKLVLQGGQVRFTDNFIKPNYSANLMKFGGTVTGLSSDPDTNASVDLKGLVNSAPLAIAGRVNPLKGDLSLDLKAEVRGMEMAPLSPYSGRYIGYGIEKGRLSFDVAYKVENRVLTAQNRVILEQLTLGDKVDSPTAPALPVRFALALLRDRNGVIDVNLPIGGSLDDPQFSIGGIIVRIFVNIITKAVTAPFSLLASAFGGGENLSYLAFDAGHARLRDKATDKLGAMVKALNDRPALKLEITGRYDPQADRDGLKHALVERKVRALKLRDMAARSESVEAGKVAVMPAEYPALLKRVYKDEKFPKPRNVIGLQKDVPVAEMERLMIENTTVSDNDLIDLGNRRAQATKDWLTAHGGPADRIFLLAAKSGSDAGSGDKAPAMRVDFSLR